MSKTFETNAQKALTMASGIKSHLNEVAHLEINAEGLDRLEAEAKKAIEMIQEVDQLRLAVSEKLQAANDRNFIWGCGHFYYLSVISVSFHQRTHCRLSPLARHIRDGQVHK